MNELKVKYFELSNLGLPSCFLASIIGKLMLKPNEILDFYLSLPRLA